MYVHVYLGLQIVFEITRKRQRAESEIGRKGERERVREGGIMVVSLFMWG